ncbi:hypothetical protein ACFQ9J_11300 [Streptomyces sp. NPDC056529]|uniref:hypothetical protein n=1 Tax=Streptomyces sp. NPDC056529 TaxID=3345855 RepID=UPI0036A4B184
MTRSTSVRADAYGETTGGGSTARDERGESGMNGKPGRGLRAAVAAGAAGLLLTACGSGGTAGTTPEGWGTLRTERLTVAHPAAFEEVAPDRGNTHEVARATLTEGGVLVGAMSVEFDHGSLNTVEMAAVGAEARIQLGATLAKTTEIRVAGPGGRAEARKITYAFTSRGRAGTPPSGARLEGVMVTGVDARSRPYLITVNSEEGTLSDRDVTAIVESVTLTVTEK